MTSLYTKRSLRHFNGYAYELAITRNEILTFELMWH